MYLRRDLFQGKMAIEKLSVNYKAQKIKPGPINKLKTIKKAMNSDWSDYRHYT